MLIWNEKCYFREKIHDLDVSMLTQKNISSFSCEGADKTQWTLRKKSLSGEFVLLCLCLFLKLPTGYAEMSWQEINYKFKPVIYGLDDVTYGKGRYVAVGDSIETSLDGLTWSTVVPLNEPNLVNVIFANGKFVAVGGAYIRSGHQNSLIKVSTDGIAWATVLDEVLEVYPDSEGHTYFYLADVAYGNGKFVAVGTGVGTTVMVSEDAIHWTKIQSDVLKYCSVIAFGNGRFVVGGSGYMASEDGIHWTKHDQNGDISDIFSLCFGAGKFVAGVALANDETLNSNTAVWESTDGLSWVTTMRPRQCNLHGIAYGAGEFVAVGTSAPTMLVKSGANPWNEVAFPLDREAWGVCYGNGNFIAVGDQNLILYAKVTDASAELGTPTLTDEGIELVFKSKPNCEYRIECTLDLREWLPVTNILSSGTETHFSLSDPVKDQKFYRVVTN
jgi:hypothetical protein